MRSKPFSTGFLDYEERTRQLTFPFDSTGHLRVTWDGSAQVATTEAT